MSFSRVPVTPVAPGSWPPWPGSRITSGAGRRDEARDGVAKAAFPPKPPRNVHKTALPPLAMRLKITRRRTGILLIMRWSYHLDATETIAMRDELLHPGFAPLMRYGRAGRR